MLAAIEGTRELIRTESHIRQAGGSWNALLVATSPE